MSIIVEILIQELDALGEIVYKVDKAKIFEISTIKNATTIQQAKDKLLQLKSTLLPNQKIRVLEFHNEEFGDKNRKPCKILFES